MTLNLKPATTLSSNGQSYRTFDIDGLIHPAKSITQLIPFSIYDLEANIAKRFKLSDDINFDLLNVFFRMDVARDDDISLQNQNSTNRNSHGRIHVLDKEKVIEQIPFSSLGHASEASYLIFDHKKEFEIKVNENMNRITFFCEPVYFLTAIKVITSNNSVQQNNQQENLS